MTDFISVWAGVESEAHVAVTVSGDPAIPVAQRLRELIRDKVASRIAAKDWKLWGPEAESESRIRLGWVDLHESTRSILSELGGLAAEVKSEGKTRVVLCGMGGSSLGPEVICKTYGVPLVTLDSTDPDQVRHALSGNLAATVVVVSSKSGGTVETDSQRRTFEAAFKNAGLDPRQHIVVVTDPGSPLEKASSAAGYRAVFLADPNVGGRFSVLSAFGLVPAALAGVPVADLLDEAAAVAPSLAEDMDANPALVLGAAIAGSNRDKLVFTNQSVNIHGIGDWAEQLIAESTGKNGVGLVPVITGDAAPEIGEPDTIEVRLIGFDGDSDGTCITVSGTLGGQFLLWEYATAIAGRIMSINPFDQPNVESAKIASRGLLESTPAPEPIAFEDDGIEVRMTEGLAPSASTVEEAVRALESELGSRGYLAIMTYLNRERHGEFESVRTAIARRTGRPVTFGWGPRFLHSTGQLHKGGAPVGVFLQVTGTFADDLAIPDRPFTFGTLIRSQAEGDAGVLGRLGRPVLRLNLTDESQVARVQAILEG